MNNKFNMLHHVGVVAKRVCAKAAETAAREGDDNTPSGPTNIIRFSYTLPFSPLTSLINRSTYVEHCLLLTKYCTLSVMQISIIE